MADSLAMVGALWKLPVAGLAAGQQRLQLCSRLPPSLHHRQNFLRSRHILECNKTNVRFSATSLLTTLCIHSIIETKGRCQLAVYCSGCQCIYTCSSIQQVVLTLERPQWQDSSTSTSQGGQSEVWHSRRQAWPQGRCRWHVSPHGRHPSIKPSACFSCTQPSPLMYPSLDQECP